MLIEADGHDRVLGVGDDVALAEHHALGKPGRAPGVAEVEHLVFGPFANRTVERGVGGDELVVVDRSGRFAVEEDDVLEGGRAGLELFVDGEELWAEDEGLNLAIVEDEFEFVGGEAGVQGREGHAGDIGDEVGLPVAVGVVGEDGDVVARLEAEGEKPGGEAVDAFRGLAIGVAHVAINDGRLIGPEFDGMLEDVT